MKKSNSILLAIAFVLSITFAGSGVGSNGTLSVKAQETMMKKVGNKVGDTSKKVYGKSKQITKKTYRKGEVVGGKVWNGSKWVARKSWSGGTWVAVKTVNGTKWVYRKGKKVFTGTKKRVL